MDRFQRLDDWLKLRDKNIAWLAEEIECSHSKLSRAVRGLSGLPIDDMLAIQEITGIKPAEWLEFRVARVQAGGAQKKSLAVEGAL